MAAIVRVDENDLPWMEYKESVDADGALPPMQYVEYAPGHTRFFRVVFPGPLRSLSGGRGR